MPLFTIVIPTRDRADLLRAAIASAAWQEGNDVEIIVSDNSTEPAAVEAVRSAVERSDDLRMRYIRPPESLPMPAHWEFATREAKGEYLLILTDRYVVRPGVLDFLRRAIAGRGRPDILWWGTDAGLQDNGSFFERPYSSAVSERGCRDVLADFAGCGQWRTTLIGNNSLPRGLNSAVRREIVERIRTKYGAAYVPVSPDYTSAVHQLIEGRTQVEIDAPLYAGHGNVSGGGSSIRNGVGAYVSSFGVDPFEGCPVRIDTIINTTIRDYLFVGRVTGVRLPPIDLVNYLLLNWREVQIKEEMGSSLDVRAMRGALLDAARDLPPAERDRFEQGRAEVDSRETLAFRLRNLLARHGLLDPLKAMVPKRRPTSRRFDDVLDAVRNVPVRWPTI